MNKNSKLIVLIAVIAVGAIVLVYNVFGNGSGSEDSNKQATNTNPSATPSTQQPAQDFSKELADLEGQVKNSPTDAKYADTYMKIAQIYFDQGMNNRFTGSLTDSKGPLDKAINNFQLAAKSKDAADAHAGIGAAIYNIQMVAGYFGPKDEKQIVLAEEEFNKALKLDAKNQQALYWYTKLALQLKGDTKLAEKYLKELKTTKLDDALTKEITGLESKIKEGNTSSHNTSGGTGTVTPDTSDGKLPAGHPSTDGTK
jgi:tetratricopeptide (TPR) repeat protein